jgi:hypothetical protein
MFSSVYVDWIARPDLKSERISIQLGRHPASVLPRQQATSAWRPQQGALADGAGKRRGRFSCRKSEGAIGKEIRANVKDHTLRDDSALVIRNWFGECFGHGIILNVRI